jgi:Cu/Ag efflux pump CusA
MISSTVLTLLVIPAVYSLWKERSVRGASADASVT